MVNYKICLQTIAHMPIYEEGQYQINYKKYVTFKDIKNPLLDSETK